MHVVVVESPAKAKTINKYLGGDYQVLASFGHVRDLPSKEGSVSPDEDFAMKWEVDSKSAKRLSEIASAAKGADTLILATDPDREGEAISWHVLEVLRKKGALNGLDVKRVVFNAITKSAVLDAMSHPRDIDMELVDAYLARRALDYLVGFTLSPVLWRKVPGARSAGRVQSVALRLVCERELEIEKFVPQEYWSIAAQVSAGGSDPFATRLVRFDGEKLDRLSIGSEDMANAARNAVETGQFSVASVEAKPARRNPAPPFTTSTMQQEAARKLGFAASRTMQVAQRLYEAGLITYMRTDGVTMAGEAIGQARTVIGDSFGESYVPSSPRQYTSKAKNAQEAHEAVRPTDFSRDPKSVSLEPDQAKLYQLVWNRAVASQMEAARLERTTIDLETQDGKTALRATGQVILFDGFLKLYMEGKDDDGDEAEGVLPKVEEGAAGDVKSVESSQHFTQPPPRYSEASLVKRLEELGIGRPSTYASILSVLRDRNYVRMDKNRFVPDDKGRVVTAFLENFFQRYVEYDFTADLEEQLDQVSAGDLDWKTLLRDFWSQFSASVEDIADLRVGQVIDTLNETLGPHFFPEPEGGGDPRACPSCDDGRLSLKLGRYGAFIGCSNYPDCKYTRPLSVAGDDDPAAQGDKELGEDPETGLAITLKSGRFGPYVERADDPKPKRSGLPKGWEPADVDLEKALRLLSLPRTIGEHPEDGKKVVAGLGRFGPYVKHDTTYASLKDPEDLFEIGLNRAVALIADKKAKQGGQTLKELGDHPEAGGPVTVMKGRYGPYVKHGKINASLPKDMEPDDLSMEQAVELLNARAEKTGKKKPAKKAAKKAAKKPAKKAAKKAAKKKPAKKAAKKTAGNSGG